MKKGMKMISSLIAFVFMFLLMTSFATFDTDFTPDMGAAQTEQSLGLAGKLIGAIQFVGYAIAIGMIIFIGIKYIMASANEKADLKSSLVKYLIGAVLIAGASTIAGWIFSAVKQ